MIVAFQRIERHEAGLARRFLEGLPDAVELYGIADPGRTAERTPTFCLNVGDRDPRAVAEELARRGLYAWDGDYYALEPMRALGLADRGAVRVGFLHYSTQDEVDRALAALADLSAQRAS